jgi:PLD-like domain
VKELYTNRSSAGDFVFNALDRYARNCDLRIASAFFSADEIVKDLIDRNCTIRLVVRLGAGTNPDSLARCFALGGVQIRYFVDRHFHPKLYFFGSSYCLVGSANFTRAGMRRNSETAVILDANDPRFGELSRLFGEFWSAAKVLDGGVVAQFREIIRANSGRAETDIDSEVEKKLKAHPFQNIQLGLKSPSSDENFIAEYSKKYQDFRDAFQVVQEICKETGESPSADVPQRLEVDQLLDYIFSKLGASKNYLEQPLLPRGGGKQKTKVKEAVQAFRQDTSFAERMQTIRTKYETIRHALGSLEAIRAASQEEVFEALYCVWAFEGQNRYFGGKNEMRDAFLENGIEKIKKSLSHLLHGGDSNYIRRMADCIYDSAFKLDYFAESCVEETLGWIQDEVPLCNSRVLRTLRWLGFSLDASLT